MRTARFFLYAALLLTQCKSDDPSPESQLPPATQTGANTFGCLVNGQAWTPRGSDGTANYTVSYDTAPTGGVFDIHTYRIYGREANEFQNITLFASRVNGPGSYSFRDTLQNRASFNDQKPQCYWDSQETKTTYRHGTLTITRLDLKAGVISGTFAFTLYKPGCDSIRVTNGRFDKKL